MDKRISNTKSMLRKKIDMSKRCRLILNYLCSGNDDRCPIDRFGFPIDARSGGERRSYGVSGVDRITPCRARSVSIHYRDTTHSCFTPMPTTPASTSRCRLPSPKLIDTLS